MPPNILLIVPEDTGLELSCYGDPNVRTPHLDRLAADGCRFTRAYVTQAVCSPGRASILTGLYPHECGQIGLASHKFAMYRPWPSVPTFLKQAGYRTARLGKLHVLPESAFAFDHVWTSSTANSFGSRDVAEVAREAGAFVNNGDEPFFLMVCNADAHLPWLRQEAGLPRVPLNADDVRLPSAVGCDSPRLREHAADYYNCVSRLDSGVGLLLAELEASGKADETLVIYVSDHGPQFSRGKCCVTELALQAPLIMRWPGVSMPGTVADPLVSQVDVLPTILDAVGLQSPAKGSGESLRPFLDGGSAVQWRTHLFAEWNVSHSLKLDQGLFYPSRTVRDDRYKLVHNLLHGEANPTERYYTKQQRIDTGCTQQEIDAAPRHVGAAYARWRNPPAFELYDLHTDPCEWHDLADDPTMCTIRDGLIDRLLTWRQETQDPFLAPEKLMGFRRVHDRVCDQDRNVGRDPDFEWPYVSDFAPQA
ncbi:MAG: sulfatase [Candidatus Latescibacteria bacterium]|jgi:N-sulfoglucosamine sulfohydrolase|nr:sulfatase [Gemmatimonadaceae bacterium]MDP6018269.1 sulfatase [Candidatus Latescibacterota bacterium]MDP7447895.1 sulfatase [Candidatus Latescibacterota bacterium]HJP34133.1 sulfatase [Candidatus Latescibacterota bacterium]